MNQQFGNIIDLDGNTIINVGEAVNPGDAVNKYLLFSQFGKSEVTQFNTATIPVNAAQPYQINDFDVEADTEYQLPGKVRELKYFFTIEKPNNGANTFRFDAFFGTTLISSGNIATGNPSITLNGYIEITQSLRPLNGQMLAMRLVIFNGTTLFNQQFNQLVNVVTTWNPSVTNTITLEFNELTHNRNMSVIIKQIVSNFI